MHRPLRRTLHRYAGFLKGAAVVACLLALILVLRTFSVERPLAFIRERAEDWGAWAPVGFGLVFVLGTIVLLPGWPITVAAGAVFGPVLGTVIITVASTLSAAVSFVIARYVAHDWVARQVRHYPRVHAVYRALGRQGNWKIVAAVRLGHMGPFGLQNFLFGLAPIRFWPYLIATFLVMLPGTVVYVYLGDLGAKVAESAENPAAAPHGPWQVKAVGIAAALAALVYVGHVARRALTETRRPPPAAGGPRPPAPVASAGPRP